MEFKPFKIELIVDENQLNVLKDIHEALNHFCERSQRILPKSFPKGSEESLDIIKDSFLNLEFLWKEWVLEEFKSKMNDSKIFDGIGIRRVNPWDKEELEE